MNQKSSKDQNLQIENDQSVTETDPSVQDEQPRRKAGLDFRKYTQQIWLAGLGAFSRAEEEGTRLFDSLVKVGEELESKTTEIVDTTTEAVDEVREKVNERVTGTRNKVEKALDDSINQAISRLGFASHREINELTANIQNLTAQVENLTKDINALQDSFRKK
ncbi:phasin family protein [Aquirhabdus sp.]|uniref:phasin family protein n=1 Tax=Aquirhabdus sp. TaxID=2824160 RepID=UPI00396C52D8